MNKTLRVWLPLFAAFTAVLVLTGCAGRRPGAQAASTKPGVITVDVNSFYIKPSTNKVKAGTVTFEVTNKDVIAHEMIVVQTDLIPEKLPYDINTARIPEDEITRLGEVADLDGGTAGSLTLTLQPGKYLLLCNITAHFKSGMVTPLIVTP